MGGAEQHGVSRVLRPPDTLLPAFREAVQLLSYPRGAIPRGHHAGAKPQRHKNAGRSEGTRTPRRTSQVLDRPSCAGGGRIQSFQRMRRRRLHAGVVYRAELPDVVGFATLRGRHERLPTLQQRTRIQWIFGQYHTFFLESYRLISFALLEWRTRGENRFLAFYRRFKIWWH